MQFAPLARARHVRLLARFMKVAQSLFQRIIPTRPKAKRSGTGKTKGTVGSSPQQFRAHFTRGMKHEAKHAAKLSRLKKPTTKKTTRRQPHRRPPPEPSAT